MKVPFLDLKAQYELIKKDLHSSIADVIDKNAFAGGPFVEQFEVEFARFCGSAHTIGVGSGTEALWLCLKSLGIGSEDEVITVPNTFIATVEAICLCGARPVFVDIDPLSYNIHVESMERAITPRTKAIVPVHLFGQMADMAIIQEIADSFGLHVVEDACQAHGATYNGAMAGTVGIAGCFSFYPGKNLGAYGEAGAIVTDNQELATDMRMLRDHGQHRKYYHERMGWNCRMDGIQGAILSVKLKHLEQWTSLRRRCAAMYDELLSDVEGVITPKVNPACRHVYHIYAIRSSIRDEIQTFLNQKEIQTGIHYPIPIHLQNAFSTYRSEYDQFPVSEQCANELLSLPIYPELSRDQIEYVCQEIKNIVHLNDISGKRQNYG